MEINGKTYRNLESQVGYLTEVTQDLSDRIEEVAANVPSKVIVEELPEVGDPTVTYYVGPKGTDPNYYYEVWIWVQEEPDGPFVWRELEDTDSVDLSGYLQKVTTTTTRSQLYGKHADGSQIMFDVTDDNIASTVVKRTTDNQINTALTPVNNNHATSKKYVDDNFLAKQTGTSTYPQVYLKADDGTQTMKDVSTYWVPWAIPAWDASGHLYCGSASDPNHVLNRSYADGRYVAKKTNSTSTAQLYAKNAAGDEQQMIAVTDGVWANGVPIRTSAGQINIPLVPVNDNHATSKKYVDDAVGQLIYHHKMSITYTTVGTDYVAIAAHIDDNASTAYTDVNWHNMPLLVPDYAVYHYGGVDYMASVVKMPRNLHQDEFDEPQDGFMITYWNGSAYVNERINSTLHSTPTVTDVVTTW